MVQPPRADRHRAHQIFKRKKHYATHTSHHSDGWVHLTGQMPFSGTSINEPYPQGIAAQTLQVMHNLKTVLSGVGLGLADVVQVRVYLLHFERDYDAMNAVYATCFEPAKRPARTCIGVSGLAKGALIEIDMVARRPQ